MEFQGKYDGNADGVHGRVYRRSKHGDFLSSASRLSERIKVGIMLAISMTASTLAGLMNAEIKYVVDQKVPWISKLNPAALISDAFYCINVYEDPVRMRNKFLRLQLWRQC